MLIYIAAPFRGPTAWDVEQNVRFAERNGLIVAKHGYAPVIPHTMYRFFNGQANDEFWIKATTELLLKCDAALFLGRWQASVGCQGEYQLAKAREIPFYSTYSLEDRYVLDWLAKLAADTGRAQ